MFATMYLAFFFSKDVSSCGIIWFRVQRAPAFGVWRKRV